MFSTLQVRPLIPTLDLADCAYIDAQNAGLAWSVDDYRTFLADPCCGGHVATWDDAIVGLLLYQADRAHRRLHLVRIRIAAGWQRRHVGSRLVQHLRQWLRLLPDVRIRALVSERRLDLQVFLRANGFRAIRICKGRPDDDQDDGYLFDLGVDATNSASRAAQPVR